VKVGDLVRWRSDGDTGIVTRDMGHRCMVFFFDNNSQHNMDKRLLELVSESR